MYYGQINIFWFWFLMLYLIPFHYNNKLWSYNSALREESSQANAILQYKLLASILSAVCNVIQQS